jgi:hypothetical protein
MSIRSPTASLKQLRFLFFIQVYRQSIGIAGHWDGNVNDFLRETSEECIASLESCVQHVLAETFYGVFIEVPTTSRNQIKCKDGVPSTTVLIMKKKHGKIAA